MKANKAVQRIPISELLNNLAISLGQEEHITYGELVKRFGEQAFGLIIILFALPSALPLSVIPGVSFVFSLPVVLIAVHLIIGRRVLWLPRKLREHVIVGKHLIVVINKTLPFIKAVERWLKPRWLLFSTREIDRIHGVTLLLLSLLLLLPIPFTNFIFAALIIFFGLGLTEKDGVCFLIAYIVSIIYLTTLFKISKGLLTWWLSYI